MIEIHSSDDRPGGRPTHCTPGTLCGSRVRCYLHRPMARTENVAGTGKN